MAKKNKTEQIKKLKKIKDKSIGKFKLDEKCTILNSMLDISIEQFEKGTYKKVEVNIYTIEGKIKDICTIINTGGKVESFEVKIDDIIQNEG